MFDNGYHVIKQKQMTLPGAWRSVPRFHPWRVLRWAWRPGCPKRDNNPAIFRWQLHRNQWFPWKSWIHLNVLVWWVWILGGKTEGFNVIAHLMLKAKRSITKILKMSGETNLFILANDLQKLWALSVQTDLIHHIPIWCTKQFLHFWPRFYLTNAFKVPCRGGCGIPVIIFGAVGHGRLQVLQQMDSLCIWQCLVTGQFSSWKKPHQLHLFFFGSREYWKMKRRSAILPKIARNIHKLSCLVSTELRFMHARKDGPNRIFHHQVLIA